MFTGQHILIARNIEAIGHDLCQNVHAFGGEPVGPVATVSEAFRLLDHVAIQGAIMDEYLQDGTVAPLVLRLKEQRVPFVLLQSSRLTLDLDAGGYPVQVFGAWTPPFHVIRELEAEIEWARDRVIKEKPSLPETGPRHLKR